MRFTRVGYTLVTILWLTGIFGCNDVSDIALKHETQVQVDTVLPVARTLPKSHGYPSLTDATCEAFLTEWGQTHEENLVRMQTNWGDVVVELFDDVPLHRANFHYKVFRNYYNRTEVVRIVPDFVVQGGNSEEDLAQEKRWLIGKHTLPAEFRDHRLHFRGALAMGRTYQGNPDKRSASYDFYLVVGHRVSSAELFQIEQKTDRSYTEAQKSRYMQEGGAPHLDGEHTVFGRIVSGFDVLDTLASLPTDNSDWPLRRVEVRMAFE